MFLHATKRHILDRTSYVHSQHKFIMVHGRATNQGSADKGMVRTLRSEQSDGTETLQSICFLMARFTYSLFNHESVLQANNRLTWSWTWSVFAEARF
jgi:hypothetical protein